MVLYSCRTTPKHKKQKENATVVLYCTFSRQLAGHWHDRAFKFKRKNGRIRVVRGTERKGKKSKSRALLQEFILRGTTAFHFPPQTTDCCRMWNNQRLKVNSFTASGVDVVQFFPTNHFSLQSTTIIEIGGFQSYVVFSLVIMGISGNPVDFIEFIAWLRFVFFVQLVYYCEVVTVQKWGRTFCSLLE